MTTDPTVAAAILPRESDDGFRLLATVTVGTVVLRFADNPVNVASGGNTYIGFPFEVTLSTDNDGPPRIGVRLSNVSREVIEAIEGIAAEGNFNPPEVLLTVVLASNPDFTVRSFPEFKVQDMVVDAMTVIFTLGQGRIWNEQWPKIRATVTRCPSLF